MPGVYREEPSREAPDDDPRCKDMKEFTGTLARAAGRRQLRLPVQLPEPQNLIAVIGDDPTDPDRRCDRKCNLQIEGMGKRPQDVVIEVTQAKPNVLRVDRADGIYLRNFTLEYAESNNIYVDETNGFRIQELVSR